ncbi:putative inorganic polyphosphate/ATP-NAD kinase [Syntrophobacter sp. SbD1]|nr:putative inorganic polyphosphate/ATP-NAD kinase [Syntrophobacter sp. SbD1]
MRHVAIIYKRMRPEAARLALELKEWFVKRNTEVFIKENIDNSGVSCVYEKINIPGTVEAVVVIGGDGTFLSVARFIERKAIPIIGINLGGLGFLTEISADSCFEELEKILSGDFEIEERMVLRVSVKREGKEIFSHRVLNDAVINKGALARIIDLHATIDGHFLTHYRGDGLIICTPTGSTAYNISAGGPIIFPTAQAIILTPICPFTLTNRPIVFPANVTIVVEIAEPAADVTLTCDGQVGCLISDLDQIVVTAAATPIRIIKAPGVNHFEILRSKLKWGQA